MVQAQQQDMLLLSEPEHLRVQQGAAHKIEETRGLFLDQPAHLGFAPGRWQGLKINDRPRQRRRRIDHLQRSAGLLSQDEARAQRLVPAYKLIKSVVQSMHIQQPRKSEGRGNGIHRGLRLQLRQEPEPLL